MRATDPCYLPAKYHKDSQGRQLLRRAGPGGRMRRLTGFVAAGLGTFLLVVALLMHFYVPGVITKFPLNTYTVSTLLGHNVSYFSPSQLTELSGVTMRATNTTEGDGSAGN